MTVTTDKSTVRVPSPWPRRIVLAGLVWAGVIIVLLLVDPEAEMRAIGLGMAVSALYGWGLWFTKARWLPRLSHKPMRNAFLLGIFNAAVIETVFLLAENVYDAEGVAAHPNLAIDLLITMPWYIGLVVIFVRVQDRRRFSPWVVLLLGGLYELGPDGILEGMASGAVADPAFWIQLPLVAFWMFVPVYSSIVLPPALLVATTPAPPESSSPAWRDALRPLWWFLPFFAVYLVAAILALMAIGLA